MPGHREKPYVNVLRVQQNCVELLLVYLYSMLALFLHNWFHLVNGSGCVDETHGTSTAPGKFSLWGLISIVPTSLWQLARNI